MIVCENAIKDIFKEDLNNICNFVTKIVNIFEQWQIKNDSFSLNFNFQHFSNQCKNYGLSESIIYEINSIYRFNHLNYQVRINSNLDLCLEQILKSNKLTLLIDNINIFIKELEKNIKEIIINEIKLEEDINIYQKDIQEIEKKINKLNSSISLIENLGHSAKPKDVDKKSSLKIKLQDFENTNKQKNDKISEINLSIQKTIEKKDEINEIIDNLKHFKIRIEEFISMCNEDILDFRKRSDLFFLLNQYQTIIKNHIIDNNSSLMLDKVFGYYFGDN